MKGTEQNRTEDGIDTAGKGIATTLNAFDINAGIIQAALKEKMSITSAAILAGTTPDQRELDAIDKKAGFARAAVTATEKAINRLKNTVRMEIFDDRMQAAYAFATKYEEPIKDEHAFAEKIREILVGKLQDRQIHGHSAPPNRKPKPIVLC